MKENNKYMEDYRNYYSRPAAMNMVEDEKRIWMVLLNRNGICEIDKETQKAKICKIFEEESLSGECLYCHIEKVNQRLIFSPARAKKIAVYDLLQDSITYISLNKLKKQCKQDQEGPKFLNIIRHHSDVYLLGYSYPAIIKINMNSMEVTYITDWVEEIDKRIKNRNRNGYFGDGYVIVDNLAFIPIGCMNGVLEFNLNTNSTKLRLLNVPVYGIGGLSSADGKNFWIIGKNNNTNRAYCWNSQTEKVKEYFLDGEEESVFDPFYAPICMDYKVFFIPKSASYVHEFDTNTKKINKNKIINKILEKRENPLWPLWKIMSPGLCNSRLIFISCAELIWHEYNTLSDEMKSYHIYLNEETKEIERYFDDVYLTIMHGDFLCSEMEIPFKYFITKIKKNRKEEHATITNNLIGKHIYDLI